MLSRDELVANFFPVLAAFCFATAFAFADAFELAVPFLSTIVPAITHCEHRSITSAPTNLLFMNWKSPRVSMRAELFAVQALASPGILQCQHIGCPYDNETQKHRRLSHTGTFRANRKAPSARATKDMIPTT